MSLRTRRYFTKLTNASAPLQTDKILLKQTNEQKKIVSLRRAEINVPAPVSKFQQINAVTTVKGGKNIQLYFLSVKAFYCLCMNMTISMYSG